MLDFVNVNTEITKQGMKISPEFMVKKSEDVMIRGKSFYAIWDEEAGFWSRDENDIQRMVDEMVMKKANEIDMPKDIRLLKNFSSNKWTEWQKYCKSMPDNYHELDEKILFSNDKVQKKDYVTKVLPYPLELQPTPSYDKLMSVLYSPSEREKLEWAIGSIISGDSKWIQKFIVLYGGPGTGKSTILNIIQDMFPGFSSKFEAKDLGSNAPFGLESMKENPLIAIQHDGDLSRIEDNTKLNSITSHEEIVVNEKYKSIYSIRFHSFLFMGTNKPVKITDSKSGILRRLIDVSPTGEKIPKRQFDVLMKQIGFEHSGIAYHCLELYKKLGSDYYDDYIPVSMIGETNDFYNFIEDNYDLFTNESPDGLMLSTAWRRYKEYCEDANISYPLPKRLFRSELKNYFEDFKDRYNGHYSVYFGFKRDKFSYRGLENEEEKAECDFWLKFEEAESDFDDIFQDCPAQLANQEEKPNVKWENVRTTLKDIDTHKLHYVRVPENLIVIDFDLKVDGKKDFRRNLEEASKWPQTYAELSKSGSGIHLHYYYNGDVQELQRIYGEDVEIKVFTGKSSLRRMLTKCVCFPIATISSGLPLKEGCKKMLKEETVKSERGLRKLIERNLKKEIHRGTKPSIDFIYKILEDAYESGLHYDVTDLRPAVQNFAMNSTHQAEYCLRMVSKMKFQSEEISQNEEKQNSEETIVFFDVEIFPNLFVICWKKQGSDCKVVSMINPSPQDVESLTQFRLVGFNNRDYDNHILYGRMMGYTNEQLFGLSQRIIAEKDRTAKFGEAFNLSYTDIYDFLSASNKMSLKKWEIKLGIHHQELGLPWDKPVDKSLWAKVAEYCGNDVIATEAVWNANQSDWVSRQILADLSGLTANDTTNSCTTKIIIGNDKDPWSKYVYTDLSKDFPGYEYNPYGIEPSRYLDDTKIVQGKSIYRGEDPGEGGYVYAEPGMYFNVALLDIASMHPNSLIQLNLFGDVYTMRFKDLVDVRLAIKHEDFNTASHLLNGVLQPYIAKIQSGELTSKQVADALKTAINSVYGLTSAKFSNKLKDPRNVDNIVAKRGALFMIDLKHAVQERGGVVVHIKTDSIKIANATPYIIQFVMDYGKKWGYTFEHEDTYSKMCIVNDAVYIAKYATPHIDKKTGKEIWWTATGTQFQVPYVFKTLFSHEPIQFDDLCETKSVSTSIYLDMNESLPEGEHDYRFVGRVGGFCPMVDGVGGGILLREGKEGKFDAITGTKRPGKDGVYRWMETEMVLKLGLEDKINRGYYNRLVDKAVETISKYGDFEQFVADDLEPLGWIPTDQYEEEELPFPMNPPLVA